MKPIYFFLLLLITGCGTKDNEEKSTRFSSVEIENVLQNDSLSIRAIEVMKQNLAFAANRGTYGLYNQQNDEWKTGSQKYDTIIPEFRAVASTSTDFFMLSVGNPALLFKTGDTGEMELVYKEEGEGVFYDSMAFWNDEEGLAMGDPTNGCLSVIITRNGGSTWEKLSCASLPKVSEGEAAFAASNSNIAIEGDKTWILSGGMRSRIFYSPDKGESWKVFETPLIEGGETTGGYSIDFYNDSKGIIVGGDYTQPEKNTGNIAITTNGGEDWKLMSDGEGPGYLSGVRYFPGRQAEQVVGVGPGGIFYSTNSGEKWERLSQEAFHALRFVNDSVAYAAGDRRIARLIFR